jgi:hypothetical protein
MTDLPPEEAEGPRHVTAEESSVFKRALLDSVKVVAKGLTIEKPASFDPLCEEADLRMSWRFEMPTAYRSVPTLTTNHTEERLLYPASVHMPGPVTARTAVAVAITEEKQRQAWRVWLDSKACRDLLQDMAAGEIEFSAALAVAFIAGMKASA